MPSFCYIVSATLSLEVPSFAYFIKIQCFHKGDETFLYAHHMLFFADWCSATDQNNPGKMYKSIWFQESV